MIETRLALPVRSPTPFIVPCTWRAPASTAASVLATPHSASLWQWMPTRTRSPTAADDRGRRLGDLRRQRRAVRVAEGDRLGAGAGRRAQAVQRVAAVVAVAVEEVLGVVDHALARAARGRRPTRRSSPGSRRGRRARPSRGAGPRSCRRSCTPARSSRRARAGPSSSAAATPRRRVMPKAATSACSKRSSGQQLEELELLGVRRREAGLDEVHAELVELARDAHLLGRRQRQAGALHAVAQRGVVELDVGHGWLYGEPTRFGGTSAAPGPATRGSARCARAGRPRRRSGPRG